MNEHFIVVFSLDIYPYPKQKAFQIMTYELYRHDPPPPKKKSGTMKKKFILCSHLDCKRLQFIKLPCMRFLDRILSEMPPLGTRGFKMRIGPPYPNARRKRRLKWGGFSE